MGRVNTATGLPLEKGPVEKGPAKKGPVEKGPVGA